METKVSITRYMPLKWRSICGRYTVSISEICLRKMIELAKSNFPLEVGTSLIGRYSDDGFDAYVLDTTPLTTDSRSHVCSFIRGVKGLKCFFRRLRKSFTSKRYYVGEWHSHPNGLPVPSETDDKNQLGIAHDRKTGCPEAILIIVSLIKLDVLLLGVYVYSHKQGKVNLCPDDQV